MYNREERKEKETKMEEQLAFNSARVDHMMKPEVSHQESPNLMKRFCSGSLGPVKPAMNPL